MSLQWTENKNGVSKLELSLITIVVYRVKGIDGQRGYWRWQINAAHARTSQEAYWDIGAAQEAGLDMAKKLLGQAQVEMDKLAVE